jgi:hypothetical protein
LEYAPISWSVMKERYLNLIARLCGVTAPDIRQVVSQAPCAVPSTR